ncbi:MAG: hypothetical protein R2826_04985 [Thermoleophilia bacterium]
MDIGKLFNQAWGLFIKDVGPLIVGALIAGIIPSVAAMIVFLVAFVGASITATPTSYAGGSEIGAVGWAIFGIGMFLVAVVVVLLSMPLYAGLIEGVIERIRRGRAMGYGDAFRGFRVFGPVVGASLVIGVILFAIGLIPLLLFIAAAAASSVAIALLGLVAGVVAFAASLYFYTRWIYYLMLIVDRESGGMAALRESGELVHRTGWWMTFLAAVVIALAIGVVSGVLGLVPVVGTVASFLVVPFGLTYTIAMYFQATNEGTLVDATIGRLPYTGAPGSGASVPGGEWPPYPPSAGPGYGTATGVPPLPPAPPFTQPPPAQGWAAAPPASDQTDSAVTVSGGPVSSAPPEPRTVDWAAGSPGEAPQSSTARESAPSAASPAPAQSQPLADAEGGPAPSGDLEASSDQLGAQPSAAPSMPSAAAPSPPPEPPLPPVPPRPPSES